MPAPKVISIATVLPEHEVWMVDILEIARLWVSEKDPVFQRKVDRIFRNSGVKKRYTVLPIADTFKPMTLDAKNGIYRTKILDYAEQAVRDALTQAHLTAQDIDCLIVTSCTGHMSPSIDAFLMNRMEMKPSVQRLPVMEMGCIGGLAGLIYAENYLRAYPDKKVALVTAELTSITFQNDDFSWANVVSSAIFGDGIACAILGDTPENRPEIRASSMYHFKDSIDLLGFDLSSTGFRMVLDKHLPERISEQFENFVSPILEQAHWKLEEIDHFLVHPGGEKILRNIEALLQPVGKRLDSSRAVLHEMGNISSATILFILKSYLDRSIPSGKKALLLGFGPGLTAASILLEWQ